MKYITLALTAIVLTGCTAGIKGHHDFDYKTYADQSVTGK